MKDPIVEEIRAIRNEHVKKFNYDLDTICKGYEPHQQVKLLSGPRRID